MKPMQAGRMKHRITFQRDDGTADVIGGNAATWTTHMSVWAEMIPQTSREFVVGAQNRPDTTHMFRIRYRAGLHSAMRVTWQGRVFHLTGPPINTEEANRELIVTLREPETAT